MSETIVRIQDREGRGPFKPGFSSSWVIDRDDHDILVPWYHQFGRVDRTKGIAGMYHGCGCRTVEQLRRWFIKPEYRRLRQFGYMAVEMEVGRILAESEIQLVFERAIPLHEKVKPIPLY